MGLDKGCAANVLLATGEYPQRNDRTRSAVQPHCKNGKNAEMVRPKAACVHSRAPPIPFPMGVYPLHVERRRVGSTTYRNHVAGI
jgi:hypothetical protein